jgi:hypothetical protein
MTCRSQNAGLQREADVPGGMVRTATRAGDMDHAHEAGDELVISRGNGAIDFQTAEHVLDPVTLLIERPVMLDRIPIAYSEHHAKVSYSEDAKVCR